MSQGVAADAEQKGSPPAVCLHTEYLPYESNGTGTLPTAIVRELGRQAVLIAARDELGLATRDETLGESFPESVTGPKRDVVIKVRGYRDGSARIELVLVDNTEALNVDFSKQVKFVPDRMMKMTNRFEEMSRDELPARLRELGFAGQVPTANEANRPDDAIEGLLLDMNFASQFAAVRAAHAAILAKGQSSTWLGVLARGYANLALMTQHHWKSDSQVFAARALLYGKRLANLNPNDSWARAHLAYAQAIVGLHGPALAELDKVDDMRRAATDQQPVPGWLELLRPYCRFEREPVLSTARQRASLRALAQRLAFEQNLGFGDDRWLFDSAKQTLLLCPEEYRVYAELSHGAPLGVVRMGGFGGPGAMAQYLPARIAGLAGLPKEVQTAADGAAGGQQTVEGAAAERDAAATQSIVLALRKAAANDVQEPSWGVLGELIFEEQFVQAANYLNVSMNATESSHADEVKAILPAVAGHRYAPHIESYAFNARKQPKTLNKTLGEMKIVDPRGNMEPMLVRTWRATGTEKGVKDLGSEASEFAFRHCGRTYPELLEAQRRTAGTWWTYVAKWQRTERIHDLVQTSPRSPQALRLTIGIVEKPTYEQARKWEGDAGEDPAAFTQLGGIYSTLKLLDDAIRCFEHSIELSPNADAFKGLAKAYRANNQEELWQPTLERALEIESLGLEHSSIHSLIANDMMSKGKWTEAEPHAVAAAESYSAWGLYDAAAVYEGLERFDESEKFIRAATENYPTHYGFQWYFWCLRQGRGDVEAAHKLAKSYFAGLNPGNDIKRRELAVVYRISQGTSIGAMEHARWLFTKHDTKEAVMPARAYYGLQLAFLARELKEPSSEKPAVNSSRRAGKLMKDNPDLGAVVAFLCDVLDGKKIADKDLADVDAHLSAKEVTEVQRGAFEYLVGRALELDEKPEQAKEHYQNSVKRFVANPDAATLAGMKLHPPAKVQTATEK